ncbi:virion protein US2 [Spheniscid alphaherpesvirus 1]|uniref:Virion protein US2 n=1 Tax=Spheniscid alphaherpesvirus 1 TaxID=2560777 RepID=A0A1R3T238_9ALPH|nr:virion protein US2 [Spheniscid alphaherpesvirus 1]
MGVFMITIATLIDEYGRVPKRTRDASEKLWKFLFEQCRFLIDEPGGIPVVVRSADLRRCAGPFMNLPRAHRPIIRLSSPIGTGASGSGLAGEARKEDTDFYEDGVESTEWHDVYSGFCYLNSIGNGQTDRFRLWIIGAADICQQALSSFPKNMMRRITVKVNGEWPGNPCFLDTNLEPVLISSWKPVSWPEKEKNIDTSKLLCRYELLLPSENITADVSRDRKCCFCCLS